VKFLHLYKSLLVSCNSEFQKHHKMSILCFGNYSGIKMGLLCLDEMEKSFHCILNVCQVSNLNNLEMKNFTNIFVLAFHKHQPH
jgi:hypothetical protein